MNAVKNVIFQALEEAKKQCTATAISSNNLTDSTSSFSTIVIPTTIDEMIPISAHLIDLFTNAIASAFPHLAGTSAVITPVSSNAAKFGDYQCNSAMSLSKTFKADQSSNISPRDIALEIVKKTSASPLIDKLEIAGAGFINVFLKKYKRKHTNFWARINFKLLLDLTLSAL